MQNGNPILPSIPAAPQYPTPPSSSCDKDSCFHGSVCVDKEPVCQCTEGYTGVNCQTAQPWKKGNI
jgi:hypothetical protein